MIDPKVNEGKIVLGPVRLSYVHVFEKHAPDNSSDAKYSVTLMIPKSEKKTVAAINKAVENAKKAAIASRWGGKEPKKLDLPLKDGDDKEDDNFAGHWVINAKSNTRPGLIGKDKQPITDEEEIYSGVWCYASINFYGYSVSGNNGIAAGLNNLMKFKDDDKFGGRVSAESDFSDIDADEDEDL